MVNEALFYTLWGVMVALIVQVLYDLLGDFLTAKKKSYILKAFIGMLLVFFLAIAIELVNLFPFSK